MPGLHVETKPVKVSGRGLTWMETQLISAMIDHQSFDKSSYYKIAQNLLDYAKAHLTTAKIAQFMLKSLNLENPVRSILFLSDYPQVVHYQRALLLHGLKTTVGESNVFDVPRIDHLYKNVLVGHQSDSEPSYGCGYTYSNLLNDPSLDRTDIRSRIKACEFDLICYCLVLLKGDRAPEWDLVKKHYPQNRIAFIDGLDAIDYKASDRRMWKFAPYSRYFRREIS